MAKNRNKFFNHKISKKEKDDEKIKEIHRILTELCVGNYNEKKIMYDRLKSIGINKKNNFSSKNIYYSGMFFKAILDKDLDKATELKNIVKKLNQETMEKTEEYQNNKSCILYGDWETNKTGKVENEGSYIEACKILKKNNDDIENIYKNAIITPNWF
jgi:hypothetical protein